jgi:outer membrane receptor protein involved in Fe transport
MRKISLLGTSALGSAAFIGFSLALAAPAHAQGGTTTNDTPPPCPTNGATTDQPATTPDNCLRGEVETKSGTNANSPGNADAGIVVTGSRIRRPNLESTVPITSLGGEEFFQQGQNNIGDALNELPQLRTTFGQQNAGRFLGTTGLNLLDLRGLGTQRTLVLVNNRRHVPSDILNNGVSPDVNTIPNDLIERVDIVTGGNSAIYGSDAIAGVVNFILKRDFEGFQIRGHTGISGYGGGANQYVSGMYGMNFADGRGNVTVHAEYAHEDRLYGSGIPFLQRVDGFLQVDSDPVACSKTGTPAGCAPNGSDGNPDRLFFRDIRAANINVNTQIAFTQRTGQPGGPQCGTGFNNTPFNCVFFFSQDGGQLMQQTGGSRIGAGPIGSFIGGNGTTGRELNGLTILPVQSRYNVNLLAHFTISDALEPFIEAKYVHVDTEGQNAGPAFIQGSTLDANRERVRLDNPFLTPIERATITSLLLQYNTQPGLSTATGAALTATQLANINNGSFRVPIQRNFLDLGVRDEHSRRDTFRIVGGIKGTFNDDWNYEVSANYGKVWEDTTVEGNVDIARLLFAMDVGRNPTTGAIECRSKFDPAARIDVIGDANKLAADIAACVPYNPFGNQPGVNEAARQYIVNDTTSHATLDQLVLSAFMAGDTSSWINLPGGPVSFAVGAEYRRERLFYQADPFIEQGLSFYNALPTFKPAPFDVKEAYAEVRIPILKDMPFFEELTLSAAARVASYGGGTGTVWAYNAGGEWAPIRDIRFRANYGRSVRAPALTETAFPLSQNFAPGFADPCRPSSISGGPNRQANCSADLGALLGNLPDITYSLELQSGSNPDLKAETSDSWTFGTVIQPHWIPGLSLTVDYYDITVKNVIGTLSAQTIVNSCYDQPDLNNQYCALFTRYRGPTPGPGSEVSGQILQGSLVAIPLNFSALVRRGIDTELAYRTNINENVKLAARLIYTHNLQISNFTNPAFPNLENRIMSELGDPQDEARFNLDLTVHNVTLGYQARYIGKQVVNAYEDFNAFPNACSPTTNTCPPFDADWADRLWYPSVLYHNARVSVDVGKQYNFYFGVDNLFDRNPPMGLTGVGAGSGIYSIRGRTFYGGFRARF